MSSCQGHSPAPPSFPEGSDRRLDQRLDRLWRDRPRDRWLRASLGGLAGLMLVAWANPTLWPSGPTVERRLANLERFLGELRPFPLQGRAFDFGIAWGWALELLSDRGWEAVRTTLALSVVAIVLAAAVALMAVPFASRTLATAEPFLPSSQAAGPWQRAVWRAVVPFSRTLLILLRSIPEYVWAFLLLALLGPSAWPIVLALALHNLGILGKLGSEVVDDLETANLEALRGLGAGRVQIAVAGIFPQVLPRFLLLFFYRWETCVREATVLGMLGIASLGFWIVDARARQQLDVVFFYIALGALLVLAGDLVSTLVRRWLRRVA